MILFTFTNKGHFLHLRVRRGIKHHTQKLGHDILCYISKFQHSDGDNYFFIGKKPS